ncbi:hypothetical protein HCG60_07975 [Ligilactobacillus murinus]|uniref:hypothetical protein n=1 Tax=Ligilactobacillus murinus TaxID=1622 RepID=UPI001C8B8643|nr:hypothetical protein [Ligilactobacillus murinus]MBX9012971.1 hypothetical protein [Ligilactobacillus murinus]
MEWQKYLARLRYYDRMCGNLPMVHQKIAQVQAVVKAYSRHEIPQEVPKLSFSAHYLELHMTKHPELFELVSCLNDLRQVLIENFGIWHVFSRAWLASFKQQLEPGKTLVVMCGNAALAANLSNVIAVDDFDWQAQDNTRPHPWCDVKRADALVAVQKYYQQVDNIILEWAPETTCDRAILDFLRAQKWPGDLIVIGEAKGATNSSQFWQTAKLSRPPAVNALHRPFDFIHDQVFWVK